MAVSDTLAEISPEAVPESWHPEAVPPPHAVIAKTIQPARRDWKSWNAITARSPRRTCTGSRGWRETNGLRRP